VQGVVRKRVGATQLVVSCVLQGRLKRDGAIIKWNYETAKIGPERVTLKNLKCQKPLPGNGWRRHSRPEKA
jgi:hypothetical protein